MRYSILGGTGIRVSRLCFGSLTVGPLQANLPLLDGAGVISAALDAGVNFIDTAELYNNYQYIRTAIQNHLHEVVITSKSYAYTYEDMQNSVEKACREVGRDYIDIFMLHEQVSRLTLMGHDDGLKFLVDAKKKGIIRAIGVSTHMIEVVKAVTPMSEIDVIHPILNMAGIGIGDGGREEMLSAITDAAQSGKGVYTMKALGGGHLSQNPKAALDWILSIPYIHSVAVGMQTCDEVEFNCRVFNEQPVPTELQEKVLTRPKKLLVEEWCIGCGRCAEKCPMKAIRIINGQAVAGDKCILCGYCGAYCPEFCLKIV